MYYIVKIGTTVLQYIEFSYLEFGDFEIFTDITS